MNSLTWILLISAFQLVLTTGWTLRLISKKKDAGSNPVLSLRCLLSVAMAGAGAGFFLLLALRLTGISAFGTLNFIWLVCAMNVPILAACLLLYSWITRNRQKGLSRLATILCSLGVFIAPVAFWMSMIEPFRLQLEKERVPILKNPATSAITIGILADIQTNRVTEYERRAVDKLIQETPDVVLIPGDLFQGTREEFSRESEAMTDLMNRVTAPSGAFAVMGNVDAHLPLMGFFAKTPVRYLQNQIVITRVKQQTIAIAGIEYNYNTSQARETIRKLCQETPQADVRILLCHTPDSILSYGDEDVIDLIVCGHTHGGQLALPGYGALWNICHIDRKYSSGGLFNLGSPWLYVSRGVGYERNTAPRIRAFCPPEITLLTLESEE